MKDNSLNNNFLNVIDTTERVLDKKHKTFNLNASIYDAGKYFARLLGIDHGTLLDRAVSEYIQNHKADIPLNINVEYELPKLSPELIAATETEAADLKRIIRQNIGKLNRALSKPTPLDVINKHRRDLHKSIASTRRFLNSNKSYRDAEFSNYFIEADEALEKASERLECKY